MLLLALPALVLLPVCAFLLFLHAVRRLREGGWPRPASPRPFAHIAGMAGSGAVLFAVYADFEYAFRFKDSEDLCMREVGLMVEPEHESLIPLSAVCSGVQVFPAWVNPVLFGLIGLAAACLVASVLARRALRRRAVLSRPAVG